MAFLAARGALRPVAERAAGEQLGRLERVVERVGARRAVVLARLTPVLPYELTNYALGLCSSVALADFALCSWASMLPGTIVFVTGGSAVGEASGGDAGSALRLGLVAVAGFVLVALAAPLAREALGDEEEI